MTNSDDLYGMELDRRLTAERALTAVVEVVEAYESCGPKQQSTRDVLAAVRAAFECSALHGLDYRAAFYRVRERCEELKTSVAEHQYNALEMARKADLAERRAEEAEFHVEQLRDARDAAERRIERAREVLDGWEHDGPKGYEFHLLILRVREALDGAVRACRRCECGVDGDGQCPCGCDDPDECVHDWLDRPESDTRECLICGAEVSG